MDYQQYIEALFSLQSGSERILLDKLPVFQRMLVARLFDYIDENFEVAGGKLILSENNRMAVKRFPAYFRKVLISDPLLEGLVTKYVKEVQKTDDLISTYQRSSAGVNLSRLNLSIERKIIFDEIINQFEDAGMDEFLTQPLRNSIYLGVSRERSLSELKSELHEIVPGKSEKYLSTVARNGLSSYTGMVNKKLMEAFDFNGLLMVGSLIETSAEQCIYGVETLKGVIRISDWPRLRSISIDNGLVPGTTFFNLPFNKLHYNCRHDFTPTIVKP